MIGHLGARASALLDGQLSPEEAEEAWAHVYVCHACRDLVEREGWVKTRLAGLSCGDGAAPQDLKGSLLSMPPGDRFLLEARHGGHGSGSGRRSVGVAVLGGGAIGAAMVGVLALGLAPASTPTNDRRPPASRVETPAVTSPRGGTPSSPAAAFATRTVGSSTYDVPDWVQQLLP